MTKKEIATQAMDILEKKYPDAICSLDYRKDYELLISTRLAAQCTDARVNLVTPVRLQIPHFAGFGRKPAGGN